MSRASKNAHDRRPLVPGAVHAMPLAKAGLAFLKPAVGPGQSEHLTGVKIELASEVLALGRGQTMVETLGSRQTSSR